jgi:2-pyrone-4,6-dicarboxylate lactonase
MVVYTSRDALPQTFIALQEKLGLSRAVIVSPGAYGRDYRLLAETLARFPDRFRGVALMPEETGAAELARLTRLGVRGLRMMSAQRGAHVPHLSPAIASRAAEHGWHVQFYPHGTDIIAWRDGVIVSGRRLIAPRSPESRFSSPDLAGAPRCKRARAYDRA